MNNPTNAASVSVESTGEPRFAADEEQPESSSNERNALAEREDGTIRAGNLPQDLPGGAPPDAIPAIPAIPLIRLTADEQQPIDAVAEYQALSEREDGTNVG